MMDFEFTEDQEQLRMLTRQILDGHVTPELLRHVDASDDRFDGGTWQALADANLLGIALPEQLGGSGYGLVEQCIVLEEIGRALAPVPAWASCVLGAMTLATYGTDEQRSTWVPRAAVGEIVLTAALQEPTSRHGAVQTTAVPDGVGWRLNGVKSRVPAGVRADAAIIPARVGDAIALFLVATTAPGLAVIAQQNTTGEAEGWFELDDVIVDQSALIGSVVDGAAILEWLTRRAEVTLCALQLGICTQALDITVEYTKTRQQFKRPIASFQAVGHRAADCFIDLQAMGLTLWQAVYQLEAGLAAGPAVDVAKFWAAEGGQRIVHAAVHLHGGIGTDRDGPMHRYFLAAKQLEFTLGAATEHLLAIGDALADGSLTT